MLFCCPSCISDSHPIHNEVKSTSVSNRALSCVESNAIHVVAANALGVGHYTPMANMVQCILSRAKFYQYNLRVTFIAPVRAHEKKGSVPPAAHPCLHFERVILEGPDVHPVNMNAMISRTDELQKVVANAIEYTNKILGWPKPVALIHDLFAVFAQRFADEVIKVPRILFNPSHAMSMALFLNLNYRKALWSETGECEIEDFARPARIKLLWAMLGGGGDSDPVFETCDIVQIHSEAKVVVSNDLPAVFPNLCKAISDSADQMKGQLHTIFSHENTLSDGNSQSARARNSAEKMPPQLFIPMAPLCTLQTPQGIREEDPILKWLDAQPERSVIFIALGTLYDIKVEDLKAMAEAMEECGHRFLWAYRLPARGVLTEEYKVRVKDRGRVATWVDQRAVLGHPSIRVFVTHGGWNSCMESFAFAGVPMICVPLGSEQAINGLLISDGLDIGEVALVEEERRSALDAEEREKLALEWMDKTCNPTKFAEGLQNFWWRGCNRQEWRELLERVCVSGYDRYAKKAQSVHIKTLKACGPQGHLMMAADVLVSFISELR